MFFIMVVAERIIIFLPARGSDVEGFSRGQVYARREDMDMDSTATLVVMPDHRPGIAIRLQSGPGEAFKIVQHFINLLGGGFVLRCPSNHRG